MAAALTDRGIPLSTLCTNYLDTNSTSHRGPFSAIAELIDNAYDPDVNAKQIWIDKTKIRDMECLTFRDDGNGLDRKTMQRMLSFGFSNKIALNGKLPIGMYGNGFKSGSMCLGQDVIVLSKSKNDLCVGMLSQTYLEKIGAKHIGVPIISFNKQQANKYILLSFSSESTLFCWSLLLCVVDHYYHEVNYSGYLNQAISGSLARYFLEDYYYIFFWIIIVFRSICYIHNILVPKFGPR
uniref:Uncharacterized protein n=1 Tax=Gadus morhua TaxID=8049 RepID=A0A8C5B3V2_GADMO